MRHINISRTASITTVILFALVYGFMVQKVIAANSILMLLVLPAAIAAIYFYLKPIRCFWVLFYSAMLAGVAVSYVPGLYNMRWGINLLALILGSNILLKILLQNNSVRLQKNTIFTLMLFFVTYVTLTSMINGVPIKQLIIGLKNNFQFFPLLLFFLAWKVPLSFSRQLVKAVILVAIIQPPIAVLQYFILVPKLKYLTGAHGASVLDAVNGSFGTSLQGGGTGMYTLYTCTVLCGLLIAYNQKRVTGKKYALFSLYVLFPMFLNETKAAFLIFLFGSMVVVATAHETGLFKKLLLGACAIIVGGLMIWFTLQVAAIQGSSATNAVERTLSYNIGEQGYGSYRLNRLTCLTFWLQENKKNPVNLLIGHGLDSTIENKPGVNKAGRVARRYPMYGTGLTTASQMLWEVGLLGVFLFMAVFLYACRSCIQLSRATILSQQDRFIAFCCGAGLSMTLLIFLYNSLFRNSQPANLFIFLLLGVPVYLQIRHKSLTAGNQP